MKQHLSHFFVLLLILGGGIAAFFSIHGDNKAQLAVGIATSIAYIVWGIIHHASIGDLHRRVVVEYILVGAVAVLVLLNVLRP